jgi:arylsulfatase
MFDLRKGARAGMLAALGLCAQAEAAGRDARPDILVIVADDLGYSDIGAYGGEIRTPTLDTLAKGGVRFTQMHNNARCCPTRASLLTGLYAHQAGLARNGDPLNRNGATLAEHLGANGYQTCMVGKWHLSEDVQHPDQLDWLSHRASYPTFADTNTYPSKRGFATHYGTVWGVIDHFDPFSLVENTQPVHNVPSGYYHTDALNDRAVQDLDRMGKSDKPIFMYLAHNAPHWPLHALPEDIARYANTYADGWDSLRVRRYRRQVEMGLITKEQYPLPGFENFNPWAAAADKPWHARNMAVHAAMIDRMDQGLARVIAKLKALGRFDNTIIMFLSDNGASPEVTGGPGYDRPNALRDGTPVTYGGRPQNGGESVWGGIGPMWANAANTPFRFWKKESYEGGIATPFIVHWPKGLKLPAGSVQQQLGHVIDIAPTAMDAAGAVPAATYNGNTLKPMEGKSLLGFLQGGGALPERELYWEHEDGKAARQGPWKLVALQGKAWELYNMGVDRTESKNLAAVETAKAAELKAKYEAWYARVMAATPVTLKIASPNGGESWPAKSVQTVKWATTNAMGIRTVKIEFDAGAGWKTVAGAAPHVGEFAWTLPDEAAAKVRVRVVSGQTAHADTSDAMFEIAKPVGLEGSFARGNGFSVRVAGRLLAFPEWKGEAPEAIRMADAMGQTFVISLRDLGIPRMAPGVYSATPMRQGRSGVSRSIVW